MSVAQQVAVNDALTGYVKPSGRGHRNPALLIAGTSYGRLVAHSEFEMRKRPDGRRRAYQHFVCACGNERWLTPRSVKTGNTSSCGCLHREQVSAAMTTHGKTRGQSANPRYREYRNQLAIRTRGVRRAKKHANGFEQISQQTYDMILMGYENKCWICEVDLTSVHWDHVQPISKGGPHMARNLRPSCGPCNLRKHATWPFTDDLKNQIAAEVRALRTSQMPEGSVTDGKEV